MRQLTILLFLVFLPLLTYAQSIEEKAYLEVVRSGPSTAPSILVITVKDLNTGISKEICTDVSSLYWSIFMESTKLNNADIKKELLTHAIDRTFSFKNKKALRQLNFYAYRLSNDAAIAKAIKHNHLRDSLAKLIKLRENLSNCYYEYVGKREALRKEIIDSIKLKRPLTAEEAKIISDLRDQYYDEYYNDSKYDAYRQVSSTGKALMGVWNHKIRLYKVTYDNLVKNLERQDTQFFKSYCHKYGLNFCHIAFKYGIISYYGDENPEIGFRTLVRQP